MDQGYTFAETLLKVENLSLVLGGRQVLRDLNVEIKNIVRPGYTQGQVVGFLGPSGIGKTQLFQILAGLQEPTSGSVLMTEKGTPVQRGMVGVVAQNYPLFEHRTVISNLLVAARQAGLAAKEAQEKSLATLERFDLADYLGFYPVQLSGGQRQRVAIAQQLLCSEHFILMDEPFSGLDLTMVEEVCGFITELASADELNTIIVVTHDIPAAVCVADTLWLMGRDRDAEGNIVPGARIQKTYNLIERGLAWHKDVSLMSEFSELIREVKARFRQL